MDPRELKLWEDFLNPDVMRPRLIAASIYIAGFELLKDSIIDRTRGFFWNGFDEKGDIIDERYQSKVLSRNRSPLYASCDWLREMGAINDTDIGALDRVKTCRNDLAHRLHHLLGSEGLPANFEKCFGEMVALFYKVELWWIKNFEIPGNPDFDGQDIDEDEIVSGRVMVLQLLCDIALGSDERSRYYYKEFRKRFNGEDG